MVFHSPLQREILRCYFVDIWKYVWLVSRIFLNNFMVQATVWCTKSFKVRSTLDEHSQWITDVCFSPRTLKIATSSSDGTVKVWDVDNVSEPAFFIRWA